MARNWSEKKNLLNQRQHGISFENAWRVFDDPFAVTAEDFIDNNGEMRYQTLRIIKGLLVMVAHVYRLIEGAEAMDFSARKADKYDEENYLSS